MSEDGYALAGFLHATIAKLVVAPYRVRVTGEENLPSTGAILCGNHVSYLDPVVLWTCAPRRVHFMAKSELFEGGLLGWALPKVLAFPIRRGEADRRAIQTATNLLQTGKFVGIFPEGTRHRESDTELGEAHSGAAFIAMRSGCPIIPLGIAGTDEALPPGKKLPRFPRVAIRYGEPIEPTSFEDGSRKERVAAMTEHLVLRISEELSLAKEDRHAR